MHARTHAHTAPPNQLICPHTSHISSHLHAHAHVLLPHCHHNFHAPRTTRTPLPHFDLHSYLPLDAYPVPLLSQDTIIGYMDPAGRCVVEDRWSVSSNLPPLDVAADGRPYGAGCTNDVTVGGAPRGWPGAGGKK